jgi:hypothetical protein
MAKVEYLKINDEVMWRGAWGIEPPIKAKVESIQLCAIGSKYGREVSQIKWENVTTRAVVSLDNGHWAYGNQLSKINLQVSN